MCQCLGIDVVGAVPRLWVFGWECHQADKGIPYALGLPVKVDPTCKMPWLIVEKVGFKNLSLWGIFFTTFLYVLQPSPRRWLPVISVTVRAAFLASAGLCSCCSSGWAGVRSRSHKSFCLPFAARSKIMGGESCRQSVRRRVHLSPRCLCFRWE